MPSVKIIHYTQKKNSDGTSPVVLQVIDGAVKKRTIANVKPEQWDEDKKRVKIKSHPNASAINIQLSDEFNRLDRLMINHEFNMERDFINYFKNLRKGKEVKDAVNGLSFTQVCALYVSQLKSGQSMIAYEARLNHFIRIAEVGSIKTSEISKRHIDKFVKHHIDKGNKRSTLRTALKVVRFVSSFAEKAGYDNKSKALSEFKLPAPERTIKNKLNASDLSKFKDIELKGEKIREMQDMFLLAVYLRGMRIGDVIQLKQSYFNNSRLVYESQKNEKIFNIKLVPEALAIVERYLDGREYLFSFFKHHFNSTLSDEENKKAQARHLKAITANINGKLKKIAKRAGVTKNVSTHIARHTFAKMAIDKVKDLNISMDLIGHSDLTEHERYIREISQDDALDDAADSIFS